VTYTGRVEDLPDLGLFPLDLVLLPGERVPLHLFEPRYRQLFADCTLEERPFVLVLAEPSGGTARVGCAARFETLVRRFEDGRLNVIVRGIEPVEILEETEGRLYFSARVRPLADVATAADPALAEDVLARFRALAGLAGDQAPGLPEDVPLSYAVAGAFELATGPKQRLLESRDEGERLGIVRELLSAADREVRHARMAAQRAATNGRVTTP